MTINEDWKNRRNNDSSNQCYKYIIHKQLITLIHHTRNTAKTCLLGMIDVCLIIFYRESSS